VATLDSTTAAEYAAEVNAADRAQVILEALADPVTAKVYNSEGVAVASGTMTAPWAVVSGYALTTSTLDGFFVSVLDTPNDGWYLRFESGSRYVRLSFGLLGSGKEAVWSLPTWDVGARAGISSGVMNVTGNRNPVWSGAPSTLSFTQGTGGTSNFSLYASDPDDDALTYSLVGTSYTGISISQAGLLTVTSAAAAATRNLTVRATDPNGLYADHSCAVEISAAAALKWHPGHYAAPDAVLFTSQISAHTALWNQIAPVANFVGGQLYVPWGQIEPTTAGAYSWSLIDTEIAKLAAAGKKTSIVVWSQRYTSSALPSTPQSGDRYFPDYLISSGDVVATGSVQQACMWRESVMDRYLALFSAMAARYDNDDRVSLIVTAETAAANSGGDFSSTGLRNQWVRFAGLMPSIFTRTPVSVKANFLTTQTDMVSLMQACADAGTGMGGPDIFPVEFSGTTDNWGQRCLRGERWNGSAWIAGMAANQQAAIPVLMEQQVVRSTTATPAMYYNAAVTRYSCTHVTWQAKATAFLYGSGGATLVPAMNWLTGVLPYIRDNNVPLRTTIPTSLA
jgi:hypothetical protein